MLFRSVSDPTKSIREVRDRTWQLKSDLYQVEDGYLTIENENPELRRRAFVQIDGALWVQAEVHRGKDGGYGERTSEFQFVPDVQLTDGWGLETIPGPLPGPDWPPVLNASGELEAADLGAPQARVKG